VRSGLQKRTYLAVVSGGLAAATAAINAVFQLAAARNLSEAQYGELATALAIVGVLGVAGSGIQISIAHDLAEHETTSYRHKNAAHLIVYELVISAVIAIISSQILHLSLATSLLIALFVPTVILLSRANGELHGRSLFVLLALFGLLLSIGKVVFGISTLVITASVSLVLCAQLIATVTGAWLCLSRFRVSIRQSLTEFSSRLGQSVVMSALVWLIANLDILIARVKFGGDVSGNIAVTSLFATVLLVIPQLVATVVYPVAVRRNASKTSTLPLLLEATALSILIPSLMVLLAISFESFLFDRLVGGAYKIARDLFVVQLVSYLPVAGIVGVAPLVLLRVRRRHLFQIALTVAGGSASLLMFATSPRQVVNGLVVLHLVLFLQFFAFARAPRSGFTSASEVAFGITQDSKESQK